MNDFFLRVSKSLLDYAALASLLLTIFGVLFSVATTRLAYIARVLFGPGKRFKRSLGGRGLGLSTPPEKDGVRVMTHDSAPNSSVIARAQVKRRLNEAIETREQWKRAAKISKWAANFLTFGQYVVGGVLASSFIQESLSPKTVGFFGILVLIASLVKQQYHPEVNAEGSKRAALRLQALIRGWEDQLVALEATSTKGEDRTDAMISLTTEISRGLSELENSAGTTAKAVGKAAAKQ